MKAIVYTTGTGSTKRYAGYLSEKTGLPAMPLKEAVKKLPSGTAILYMGWVMAGGIQGYAAAARRFGTGAVCAVGMSPAGTQDDRLREKNAVPGDVPLFTLQGNLCIDRLHGLYRLMMKIMIRALEKKKDRTPDEEEILQTMCGGADHVHAENLSGLLDWYKRTE